MGSCLHLGGVLCEDYCNDFSFLRLWLDIPSLEDTLSYCFLFLII